MPKKEPLFFKEWKKENLQCTICQIKRQKAQKINDQINRTKIKDIMQQVFFFNV